MSLKRIATDDEIEALAAQFRALWTPGNVVRPWFRLHRELIQEMVHGAWSWEAVARALTAAGITYRTGRPWTAKWLRADFSRAQVQLKGYRRRRTADAGASHNPPERSSEREEIRAWTPETPPAVDDLEFKPASFIDWDAQRHNRTDADQPGRTESAGPGKSSRYEEVIAHLTGKKPPA